MLEQRQRDEDTAVSINSDVPKLEFPPGLMTESDPLRVSVSASLNKLRDALQPDDEGKVNYVPVAWAFREAVDTLTVLVTCIAVAPLAPSDAPLPGWRRRLWHSRFCDVAPDLLNWAVAYLPRRCRSGNLASGAMCLLFGPGVEVVTGPSLPFTMLLGLGDNGTSMENPWRIWRHDFFSCGDVSKLPELAMQVVTFFDSFNELLQAIDKFLAAWNVKVLVRGGSSRLVLQGNGSHELPPFLAAMECPHCHHLDSMFELVAARSGENFLYSEVGTGHLLDMPIDMTFRRRFFAQPSKRVGNMRDSLGGSAELESVSDDEETGDAEELSPTEVRASLLSVLSEEVFSAYHLPVISVIAESGGVVPYSMLVDPSVGCRDVEAVVGHLSGMLKRYGEMVRLRGGLNAEQVRPLYTKRLVDSYAQLSYWAEDCVVHGASNELLERIALTHLANWVVKSREAKLLTRLCDNKAAVERIVAWLAEESADDTKQELVLKVSDDWLELWGDRCDYIPQVVKLRLRRASCWRRLGKDLQARGELDEVITLANSVPDLHRELADALAERMEINLHLGTQGLAADDGATASELYYRLLQSKGRNVLLPLLTLSLSRVKVLLDLERRSDAMAVLHKAVEISEKPKTAEEKMAWAQLNFQYAEMLRKDGANRNVMEACYERVLQVMEGEDRSKTEIAEMWALSRYGLIIGLDKAEDVEALQEVKSVLTDLNAKLGREDLRLALAEVLKALVLIYDDKGQVSEALTEIEAAIGLYKEQVKTSPLEVYRLSLAMLWEKRAHLLDPEQVEQVIKSLDEACLLLSELIEDGREDMNPKRNQLWVERAMIRLHSGDSEKTIRDFEFVAEQWTKFSSEERYRPMYIEVFRCLARLYRDNGKIDRAITYYDRAVEITKACQELEEEQLSLEGSAADSKDDVASAAELPADTNEAAASPEKPAEDDQAVTPSSEDQDADAGEGLAGVSVADTVRASALQGSHWYRELTEILEERVWLLYNAGKLDLAASDFTNLIEYATDNDKAKENRLYRALCYLRCEYYDEALDDFTALSNGEDLLIDIGLARSQFGVGMTVQASQIYQKMISDLPALIESQDQMMSSSPAIIDQAHKRVALSLAHWGLAAVYTSFGNDRQADKERSTAFSVWKQRPGANGEISAEEVDNSVARFGWEMSEVVLDGCDRMAAEQDWASLLNSLAEVRILLAQVTVPEEHSRRMWHVDMLEIKALAYTGNEDKAYELGHSLLQRPERAPSEFSKLEVWVELFCAQHMLNVCELTPEAVSYLDRVVAATVGEVSDHSALAFTLRAQLRLEMNELAGLRQDLDQAEHVWLELRRQLGDSYGSWELAYIYAVEMVLAQREHRPTKCAMLLGRIRGALAKANVISPMRLWCKKYVTDALLDVVMEQFTTTSDLADVWGRLLAISVWDQEVLREFEELFCAMIPSIRGAYWRDLSKVAISLHHKGQDANEEEEQPTLLMVWWKRIGEMMDLDDDDAIVSLQAFCDFACATVKNGGWPSGVSEHALEKLVAYYYKHNQKSQAVEWLKRAPEIVDPTFGEEARLQYEVKAELDKAGLWAELSELENSQAALESAQNRLERFYHGSIPDELQERINNLWLYLADKGLVRKPKEDPASNAVADNAAEQYEASDSETPAGEPLPQKVALDAEGSSVVAMNAPLTGAEPDSTLAHTENVGAELSGIAAVLNIFDAGDIPALPDQPAVADNQPSYESAPLTPEAGAMLPVGGGTQPEGMAVYPASEPSVASVPREPWSAESSSEEGAYKSESLSETELIGAIASNMLQTIPEGELDAEANSMTQTLPSYEQGDNSLRSTIPEGFGDGDYIHQDQTLLVDADSAALGGAPNGQHVGDLKQTVPVSDGFVANSRAALDETLPMMQGGSEATSALGETLPLQSEGSDMHAKLPVLPAANVGENVSALFDNLEENATDGDATDVEATQPVISADSGLEKTPPLADIAQSEPNPPEEEGLENVGMMSTFAPRTLSTNKNASATPAQSAVMMRHRNTPIFDEIDASRRSETANGAAQRSPSAGVSFLSDDEEAPADAETGESPSASVKSEPLAGEAEAIPAEVQQDEPEEGSLAAKASAEAKARQIAALKAREEAEARAKAEAEANAEEVAQPVVEFGAQTRIEADAQPGVEAGDQPSDEVGAQPSDEAGAQPSDEVGAQPSDEAGAQPSDEAGAQPSDEGELLPRAEAEAQEVELVIQNWIAELNVQVDNGFAWLDQPNGVGQAENAFRYVGARLAECPDRAGALMAGLLEGLIATTNAYLDGNFDQEASRLIDYACSLGQAYLENTFNVEAWPWWGDAFSLAGRIRRKEGDMEQAAMMFLRARDVFFGMLSNSNNPESRVDVFRNSGSRAAVLMEQMRFEESLAEYNIAIENGLQVLVDGFDEYRAVASMHMARAHLLVEMRKLDLAYNDYQWAFDVFNQIQSEGEDCLMDICAARAGLGEVFAHKRNMNGLKEHFRALLGVRDMLMQNGDMTRVDMVQELLEHMDALGRRYFG